jgi:hypothetical protein
MRMNFKEKVENHPYIYIITAMIAAVTVAASVQQYFYSQQKEIAKAECQKQIDEANNRLASIKRGMPNNEYFDIRRLQYTTGTNNTPPATSKFIAGEFYATSRSSWEYSETTEGALIQDITGVDITSLSPMLKQAAGLSPVYLWKAHAHSGIVEKHEVLKHLFPYVSLQKMSFDQLHTVLGLVKKEADEEDKIGKESAEPAPSQAGDIMANLERYIRNDTVGSFFTMQLYLEMIAGVSNFEDSTLLNVQKVGNVLYSQSLLTIHDIQVDGKNYGRYYVTQELILIAASDKVIVLRTFIPSDDPSPRGTVFSDVTSWLDDFRVLII